MRIIWSAQSQRELLDIADYYDRHDPALANEMVEQVEKGGLPLLDFPRLGETVDAAGTRKWRVAGTPFLLFYSIAGDRIDILGVSHDRSDWQSRT